MNITTIDWVIAAVFLAFLAFGGIVCRFFIHGVSDYVVAGRHMRKFLGLSTNSAEGIGIITLILITELGFSSGLS